MLSLIAVLDLHSAPQALLRRTKESLAGFRTALGALQAFSLVTVGRGRDSLCKMHRLVALSTRKWLEVHGTLSYWQSEALKPLEERIPEDEWTTPNEWATLEVLEPHTQAVLAYQFVAKNDLFTCAHLSQVPVACSIWRAANINNAARRVATLEIRSKNLDPLDPLTLDNQNILGEALLHRGLPCDVRSARELLEKSVQGREQVL